VEFNFHFPSICRKHAFFLVLQFFHFFGTLDSTIITIDDSSNAVVPIYNLPNLKQGQNDVEVVTTIYNIVLDVKAHLPGPKEVEVSTNIFVNLVLFFVDCCFYSNEHELLLH
jgi:hypothetical protein